MAKQIPIVGEWYQDVADDQLFEVVAVDEMFGTIEIQYQGGEVGEIDLDTWQQMVLLPSAAPEDWRVSFEISEEDSLNSDDVYVPDPLDDPLGFVESDSLYGRDDY